MVWIIVIGDYSDLEQSLERSWGGGGLGETFGVITVVQQWE